jgi:DNA-binding IclR family transcriptional regulator
MSILDQVAAPVERRLPTNSLERALTFIEVIAWRTKGLTNSELCHEFRVSSSTCSYILNRLELYGFVHRDKDSGRYQIGQKIVALARCAPPPEGSGACPTSPALQTLVSKARGPAAVGVLLGGRALIIDHVPAEIPVRMKLGIGSELPLGTTLGKVLIAWLSRDEVGDLIEQYGLFPTCRAPVSKLQLFQELEEIRKCGYALTTGLLPGVRSVAAPIFDPSGSVRAGLLVSGTLAQAEWKQPDTVIGLVLAAAEQIAGLSIDWHQYYPEF